MTEKDTKGEAPASAPPPPSTPPSGGHVQGHPMALALGALGVVFGDIGTSPLYAMKDCFTGVHGIPPTPANVFGVLSLIFWALVLVVSFKYQTFILRADNRGEGGIFALLALLPQPKKGERSLLYSIVTLLVIFGAALLYGDGVITPSISVLSAVEGLEVATSAFKPVVVPLTVVILLAVFLVQKRGTAGIGKVFGPVTLVWFTCIGLLGFVHIFENLSILGAVNPIHAVRFFVANRFHAFVVLGAVVLVVTGAEALYADMGHFGRRAIKDSWFFVVMPALLLNYFGQGAHLLEHPEDAPKIFYALVPEWGVYPMVVVATAATAVASQALISGAFSLTQQAVQLGFFPRVTIRHTSKHAEGQIYIPEINWMLLVLCIFLVLWRQNSLALTAAYGIAVTGTMTITSIVWYVVTIRTFGWSPWKGLPLFALFLGIDVALLGANALKFFDGGYFPVALAAGIFIVMTTWNTGRRHLGAAIAKNVLPLDLFLDDVRSMKPSVHRVRGTAVFMASNPNGVPPILLHHFKHNQVLHEQVVLLSVVSMRVPEVRPAEQVEVQDLGLGFFRVTLRFGFMQTPDVPRALQRAEARGVKAEPLRTSYYLGRETLLPTGAAKMARWRKSLFAFVSRNATPATAYFGLPPNRVVELGMQIDF